MKVHVLISSELVVNVKIYWPFVETWFFVISKIVKQPNRASVKKARFVESHSLNFADINSRNPQLYRVPVAWKCRRQSYNVVKIKCFWCIGISWLLLRFNRMMSNPLIIMQASVQTLMSNCWLRSTSPEFKYFSMHSFCIGSKNYLLCFGGRN